MNKKKEKELDVDFIGGEELTEKEEVALKEYFSKKKKALSTNKDRKKVKKSYSSK